MNFYIILILSVVANIVVTSGIYGDIGKVPTSGASRKTAQQDRLTYTAQKTGMDGAVIAGIISRESRAGSALKNGWGDHNNGFGLMQVDIRYHNKEGTWNSEQHINQATNILISFYNTIKKNYPSASKEMWLKGAIAAYNTGPGRVKNLNSVDSYTTGGDYANDVVARAQFFKAYGY